MLRLPAPRLGELPVRALWAVGALSRRRVWRLRLCLLASIALLAGAAAAEDLDRDGVPDALDNCALVPNGADAGGQADTDANGIGDACECGDANGDGAVTTEDARTAMRCAAGIARCGPLCDANGDGDCDTADARQVQRVVVGVQSAETLTCAARQMLDCSTDPLRAGCPEYGEVVEHVLLRAGYGGDTHTRDRVFATSLTAWLDEQLAPSAVAEPAFDSVRSPYEDGFFSIWGKSIEMLRGQFCNPSGVLCTDHRSRSIHANASLAEVKLLRGIYARRQLEAVLLDFWLNHFNVDGLVKTGVWALQEHEQEAIRPHVLGRFEDMLLAVTKSVAMLDYLDLKRSRFGFTNENYARELMELHTVGKLGTYDERDVQEAARVLTGYTFDGSFAFEYRTAWHDRGGKEITLDDTEPWRFDGRLGCAGRAASAFENEGHVLLCRLATHPKTARRLSRKLLVRLLADEPPEPLIDQLAAVWLATGGDLREVARAVLFSPAFLSTAHARRKLKRPSVFVSSLVRALGPGVEGMSTINHQEVNRLLQPASYEGIVGDLDAMGEPLLAAGPPTGYPETSEAWGGGGGILVRLNLVNRLVDRIESPAAAWGVEAGTDTLAMLVSLEARLAPGTLSGAARARIAHHLDADLGAVDLDTRVRQAARLILSSPGFLVH